jgi:hypothetical protein
MPVEDCVIALTPVGACGILSLKASSSNNSHAVIPNSATATIAAMKKYFAVLFFIETPFSS